MNRKSALLTALLAGLLPAAALAQVSPAPPAAAATAAPTPPPPPQAINAKIALISFQQAVVSTNEGQAAMQELAKKYEPRRSELAALQTEIEGLQKKLQAAPATLSDEERASQLKTIDTKQKKLSKDGEEFQSDVQSDQQEAYGKIAQKFAVVMNKYVADHGYTILLDDGAEQSPIMWAAPNTDVSLAVIAAYNASSAGAAPPPSAPSAVKPKTPSSTPSAPHPSTTTPRTPGH